MPSFGDSAFIFILALLLFGPKKLPELARQLGKLMGDFRRASNEFRQQMEDELRISEQADRQKQIAALEAAAPRPALETSLETATEPHIPPPAPTFAQSPDPSPDTLPIATSGELNLMPPSTGLPVANSSLSPFLNSIPAIPDPESHPHIDPPPAALHSEAALETESFHG